MSTVATPNLLRARPEFEDRWLLAEQLLAAFCVFMVALRYPLGGSLVAPDPLAWVLIPLWLPVLRRYRGARSVIGAGLLAIAFSFALTRLASVDHHVSMKLNNEICKLLLSTVCGVGLILWAREHLRMRYIHAAFALGLLVAGPDNHKLYVTNPWKFGFSVPVTILVVGWFASSRRPRLTVALLVLFAAICTLTDARSNFAVLLLTIVLVAWRLAPRVRRRRSTILGTIATIIAIAVAAYYLVTALILDGALGAATQARSQAQIATSGSLLTGGRPELGASTALFHLRPFGFGGGTYLTTHDLLTAKDGMVKLGYAPNNGYVENFMFGRGIELHSSFFDLWAWCGLAGILLAVLILVQALAGLGNLLNVDPAGGAVTIFAAILTLWNLPFSPWLASMPITMLALGTGLVRRPDRHVVGAPAGAPRRGSD